MSSDSLKAFYDERSTLAHMIEHLPLGNTMHTLSRYSTLQAEIRSLEGAFMQTWRKPSASAVPLLPWCGMCGRDDRVLLPGKMLCAVCEAIIATGEITPGEHAETPQRQDSTP